MCVVIGFYLLFGVDYKESSEKYYLLEKKGELPVFVDTNGCNGYIQIINKKMIGKRLIVNRKLYKKIK